jgi:aspartate/methionine/tyrosine aminotransferase
MARFSSRIQWSLQPSALAGAIAGRRNGAHLLDLTISNPTEAGIHCPPSLYDSLSNPKSRVYDPNPLGLRDAREAVSEYYGGRYSPDRILLTASTSEAYSYLFKLLCDPGDEVLVPRPSYPLFEFLADLECVRTVQYPMHYGHGWFVDLDAMRALITSRTKAIVFVNPNNPTGSYLKPEEFEAMRATGLPLIFDEVFLDYAFDTPPLAYPADFILSGLSKVSGLPQMKLGWIVVNDPDALSRLELIADTFLSVGTPVQHALRELLSARGDIQRQIRARTSANLAHLHSLGLRVLHVEAGWNAILQAPRTRTEDEWVLHLLRDCGVLVQPGYFYDFESEAFLVLSLLTPEPDFAEGARRIRTALETS